MTAVPQDEDDDAHDPVDEHGHPDAQDAVTKGLCQKYAGGDAEEPHGGHSSPHDKGGVAGSFQGLRQGEGQGPEQYSQSAMHPENQLGQV